MKNFQAVDEIVDFPHEPFHKDDFAQAYTHVTQFRWECLKSINSITRMGPVRLL